MQEAERTRATWAGRVTRLLDRPSGTAGAIAIGTLIAAIYLSVVALVVELRWPEVADTHSRAFFWLEIVILAIFLAEFATRLLGYRQPLRYLFSFNGLIDVLAIAPSLVGLLVPVVPNVLWLRVLRLVRLVRLAKFVQAARNADGVLDGITRRVAPALAFAIGVKGVMVAVEATPWWPKFSDLTIVIGVSGFAIGILLGTKLGIANRRLYDVEDALCRIVGAIRDIPRDKPEVKQSMRRFADKLFASLASNRMELFPDVRRATVEMENQFEANGIGGAATAGLHRDLEFVLHRISARTPRSYERFLRMITIVYSAVVVMMVPGLIGFFALLLVVYVLGGMYVLIDDMDRPLENGADSLVSIDLQPLRYLLEEGVLSDGYDERWKDRSALAAVGV
jgi:predicted membrane chloride channel (bestrophin family)